MSKDKQIIEFIAEQLVESPTPIKVDTSLFQGRVLDSMKLVELIDFLEKKFDIKIRPMDIVFENLDSVEKMLCFIERKKRHRGTLTRETVYG